MEIGIHIKESKIEFYESWNRYVNRNISNKNLRSDFIGILNNNKFILTYKNIKDTYPNYFGISLEGEIIKYDDGYKILVKFKYPLILKIIILVIILMTLYVVQNINLLLTQTMILISIILLIFDFNRNFVYEIKKTLLNYLVNVICSNDIKEHELKNMIVNKNLIIINFIKIICIFMIIFGAIGSASSFFRTMNKKELSIMNESYPIYMADSMVISDKKIYLGSNQWVQVFDYDGNYITGVYFGEMKNKIGADFKVISDDLYIIEEDYCDSDNSNMYAKQKIYKMDFSKNKLIFENEEFLDEDEFFHKSVIYKSSDTEKIIDLLLDFDLVGIFNEIVGFFKYKSIEINNIKYKIGLNKIFVYDKNIHVISLSVGILPLNTMQYGLIFIIGILLITKLKSSYE